MRPNASLQFVMKVSKYCNLRCGYCYEFDHLDDKRRMSLDNIGSLLRNVESFAEQGASEVEFNWHGGEPLMMPVELFRDLSELQQQTLGGKIRFSNSIQTNLTILTPRHLELFTNGTFASAGVSIDVYGRARVDTAGRQSTDLVLKNLQKLLDNDINVGAIAVLSRDTLPAARRIYRFFDALQIDHRITAYYRSAGEAQSDRYALSFDELVHAYKELFDEWMLSENGTELDPIDDFVRYAVAYLAQATPQYYDRAEAERAVIVDVNGDVFNLVESYEPDYCYGNLFLSPLSAILASDARKRSSAEAHQRLDAICRRCPYFGACPGAFVANATREERRLLESGSCPVRSTLDHIVPALERADAASIVARLASRIRN